MFGAKKAPFLLLVLALCVCSRGGEIASVYLWGIGARMKLRFAHQNAFVSSLRRWGDYVLPSRKASPCRAFLRVIVSYL